MPRLIIVLLTVILISACGASDAPISQENIPQQSEGERPQPGQGNGPRRGEGDGLQGGGGMMSEARAQAIADQLDSSIFDYDAEARTLTLSMTFDEAAINQILMVALEQAGYGAAQVDLVSGGLTVTLSEITYEGTTYTDISLTATVTALDCRLDISLSADGTALPQPLVNQLTERIEQALSDALDEALSDTDLPRMVDWCIMQAVLTETTATFTIRLSW